MEQIEIWKDVPGYEGYYQVSDLGNVKSLSRVVKGKYSERITQEKAMFQKTENGGYKHVKLCKGGVCEDFKVHRLVLLAFEGKSDLFVDHINGIRDDNRLINFEILHKERKQNV